MTQISHSWVAQAGAVQKAVLISPGDGNTNPDSFAGTTIRIGFPGEYLDFVGWNPTAIVDAWNASNRPYTRLLRATLETYTVAGAGPNGVDYNGVGVLLTQRDAGKDFAVDAFVVGDDSLRSSVQVVRFANEPTGGTFTLSFDGQTTAAIQFSTNAADLASRVRTALVALSNIGANDVTCTPAPAATGTSHAVRIAFAGQFAEIAVPPIEVDFAGLTGGTAAVQIATTQQGAPRLVVVPIHVVALASGVNVTSGTMTWRVGAPGGRVVTVRELPLASTAVDVEAAINAAIGKRAVRVTGDPLLSSYGPVVTPQTARLTIEYIHRDYEPVSGPYSIPLVEVAVSPVGDAYGPEFSQTTVRPGEGPTNANNAWRLRICPGLDTPRLLTQPDELYTHVRLAIRETGSDVSRYVFLNWPNTVPEKISGAINEAFGERVCSVFWADHRLRGVDVLVGHTEFDTDSKTTFLDTRDAFYSDDTFVVLFHGRLESAGSIDSIAVEYPRYVEPSEWQPQAYTTPPDPQQATFTTRDGLTFTRERWEQLLQQRHPAIYDTVFPAVALWSDWALPGTFSEGDYASEPQRILGALFRLDPPPWTVSMARIPDYVHRDFVEYTYRLLARTYGASQFSGGFEEGAAATNPPRTIRGNPLARRRMRFVWRRVAAQATPADVAGSGEVGRTLATSRWIDSEASTEAITAAIEDMAWTASGEPLADTDVVPTRPAEGLLFPRGTVRVSGSLRDSWETFPGAALYVFDGTTRIPDGTGHVAFGTATRGTAVSRTLTIRNTGRMAVTIGAFAAPPGFTVAVRPPTSLAAGATATFTVRLDATDAGVFSGTLSFATSDDTVNPFDFRVSGTVVAPRLVASDQASGSPLASGAAYAFGTTPLNQAVTRTVLLRNSGTAPLTLGAVTLPNGFTLVNLSTQTVAVGQAAAVTIRLNATANGTFAGTLSIPTNDLDANPFTLALSGTVTVTPRAVVTLGTTPIADNTGSVNFGEYSVSSGPISRTFTLTNAGTAALTVGSVLTVPAGFEVVSGLTTPIAPGASINFVIRLNPSQPGTYGGQVSFATNDPNVGDYTFAVSGVRTFVVAEVTTGGASVPDGGSVSYGTVTSTGASKTYTIRNAGTGTLTVGTVTVPSGFLLVRAPGATVAPGLTTSFIVALNATAAATYSGQVSFATNDAQRNPYNFEVSATLVAPEIAVLIGTTNLTNNQSTGLPSAPPYQPPSRTFTIRNVGTAPLTLGTVSVPTGFVMTTAPATTLAPGASTSLGVKVGATAPGAYQGWLSIANNDSDENPFRLYLTGQITAPELRVHDGQTSDDVIPDGSQNVTYGTTTIGNALQRIFSVVNTGTGTLTLSPATAPAGYTVTQQLPSSLAPGDSAQLVVRLNATAAGTLAGDVSFANNTVSTNPFNFRVSGTVS